MIAALHGILTWENAFLFFAVVIAFFVKAIAGFGNALVLGSLFSFVVPNRVTTPVNLLMSVPVNAYLAWRERGSIHLRTAIPMAFLVIVGTIPGIFFLSMGADWLLRAALGLVVIGMATQIALEKRKTTEDSSGGIKDSAIKRSPVVLVIVGLIAGFLTGAYGVGALVAVYLRRITTNKHQYRSNVCLVLLIENLFRVAVYTATGILNLQILLLTLALSPGVAIGIALGVKTDKYVDEARLKTVVIALLIISGATLFVSNVFFR